MTVQLSKKHFNRKVNKVFKDTTNIQYFHFSIMYALIVALFLGLGFNLYYGVSSNKILKINITSIIDENIELKKKLAEIEIEQNKKTSSDSIGLKENPTLKVEKVKKEEKVERAEIPKEEVKDNFEWFKPSTWW